MSDRLDHLDRCQLVEFSLQVPVVGLQHRYRIAQSFVPDAIQDARYCSPEIVVVVTRQPNFAAAWIANPPQPPPISSNLSPCWSSSLRHTRSNFSTDASRRVASACREDATRIRHRLVEPEPEKVIAQVVNALMFLRLPAGCWLVASARGCGSTINRASPRSSRLADSRSRMKTRKKLVN